MKSKYMDFVPTAKSEGKLDVKPEPKKAVKEEPVVSAPVIAKHKAMDMTRPVKRPAVKAGVGAAGVGAGAGGMAGASAVAGAAVAKKTEKTAPVKEVRGGVKFATEKNPVLGKVENLNQHFVNKNVDKRPLFDKDEVVAVKAKKVGNKAKAVKPGAAANRKEIPVKQAYVPPKKNFVNLDKLEKRPLSKNYYPKKVETPVEEPQGPITIISKPEKQNHAGLIITVILTIILGAAAGAVAFMLLPK